MLALTPVSALLLLEHHLTNIHSAPTSLLNSVETLCRLLSVYDSDPVPQIPRYLRKPLHMLKGMTLDVAYAESKLGSQCRRKKVDFVIVDDGGHRMLLHNILEYVKGF